MRLGIIVYGLDRPITGIGRYTLELVQALNGIGRNLEIFLLAAGDLGPLSEIRGPHHIPLAGSRLLPALMTRGQFAIDRCAKELGLEVVHDPTGVSPLALVKHRTATVTTIHDVFAWSLPGYSSLLDTLIYKHWLTHRWAETDAIITVSKQSQADIIKYLRADPTHIHIVPYGVSSKFQPLPAEQYEPILRERFGITRPYVLYVGALTERKNLGRLLHAFAKTRKDHPDLLLVLAGPRSWKQSPVERTIADLELSDHVKLTGPLTDTELPSLINGALLFAFPSLYEGFGLPVLEAMACGTPVLTSDISSLPEVVGNAGVLVDPYNIEQIVHAMGSFVADGDLRREYSQRALDRASLFSWERVARSTLAIYESVGGI